jgi:hypothetical protein
MATRTWVSGVGDDANPRSRTAPCKTFAGAISKTDPSGEIDALDPGGYGAVTITKSMTIDGRGTLASILNSATTGIVVNAGVNDVVIIRNVTLNGAGSGVRGIRFLAGAALHLENVQVFGNSGPGILVDANMAVEFVAVNVTVERNGNSGIIVQPGAAGSAQVALERVRAQNNQGSGIEIRDRTKGTIVDCLMAGNSSHGLVVSTGPGASEVGVDRSASCSNGSVGIRAAGSPNAVVRIANLDVFNNGGGVQATEGSTIASYGNNRIAGNGTNGSPTTTIGQQ